MADPKHTQEQIDKYKGHTRSPKDPYERGKNDRAGDKDISEKDAQEMSQEDWQDYVDGKMGREKRDR
ncbi:hypothetical protein KIH87_10165 [Paraneptunicella aestuarii]|uniref:hypothetical protein n=1 Tax=Paraneptunicella aestuarii TaxID=2831148 RepID=UPI001E2A43D9|nr:hypothetical protein [Paraneptunicella aestuarii]UAA37115.1 hypothetical protein KIH87_10165 [Paraneptunicella aestuarii]